MVPVEVMRPSVARGVGRLGSLIPSETSRQRIGLVRQVSTASSILPEDIYDVVIVGGGIAGLALANGLRIPIINQRHNADRQCRRTGLAD